jgi:hypothetical protein
VILEVLVIQRNPRPSNRGSTAPPVRLLTERRYNPPKAVEVEHQGAWWPGFCTGWLLTDCGRGWRTQVEYVVHHKWGFGKPLQAVPAARVRLADPGTGASSGSPGAPETVGTDQ